MPLGVDHWVLAKFKKYHVVLSIPNLNGTGTQNINPHLKVTSRLFYGVGGDGQKWCVIYS